MGKMLSLCIAFLAVQSINLVSFCEGFEDYKALLEFKKGVTSDPNENLQSWDEANPLCNWTGVACHEQFKNRIVALRLEDKLLRGTLSPFLSNLSLLTALSLHGNSFQGEIPSSLGRLSHLVRLNLSSNGLQGPIPGSLEGCRRLKFFDLSENNLTGAIPEELGKMESLTHLSLAVNRLSGLVPSFLSNLTELIILELSANYFTGKIPPELGALRKLEILYLLTNYLEGSIPSALSNCTALREIAVIENRLVGEIPSELGLRLRNLEKFYAAINGLSGKIPLTLSNLSRLELLDLSRNKLTGEVPLEFGRLRRLEILYLHSNLLDYSSLGFLTALTNCSRLKKLHLASCFFSGKIPDSVGALSQDLYYFNLLNNKITGNIPESIGNLSGLVTLTLYYNFLTGKIPAQLGKLKRLQILNLAWNKISGSIPDDLSAMHSLGSLDLSNNSISGSIPKSLCEAPQLRYIKLSHNKLSGTLSPMEIARCSLLLSLDLSHNQLQGPIPSEIGDLQSLAFALNISNNDLDGDIPKSIGKLISVEAIDLSVNNLSGVIPGSIGSCIALEYLNFSDNALRGPIPDSLGEITSLRALDLARNSLNGSVPAWLSTKTALETVDLSNNKLCRGSSELPLPPCEARPGKKRQRSKKKLVFYAVSGVVFFCVLFLVLSSFVWFVFSRGKGEEESAFVPGEPPNILGRRIFSQRELEVATGSFDRANLLGSGSFGSVYKGTMDGLAFFAVKVFHRNDIGRSKKSLKREFKILSEIRHRNLVGLIGSAWNPEFKALVMEYVGNGSLEEHLYPNGSEEESCEVTMRERLSMAVDMANGLEYLHEGCPTRVVHCDVKPRNVLLDLDMVAHIADFGIGKLFFDAHAQLSSSSSTTTTNGRLRGSVGYIPPEYGEGREVSAKGDTYSFGIVLMEMVTRKRPTSGIFGDGVDIRKWVVASLPSDVLSVVDLTLKNQASLGGSVGSLERLERCCGGLIHVALACTQLNPQDRPSMSSVLPMLLHVWKDMGF